MRVYYFKRTDKKGFILQNFFRKEETIEDAWETIEIFYGNPSQWSINEVNS